MKTLQPLLCLLLCSLFCHGQTFTPGKTFVYDVQYYQYDKNITTKETITLKITGNAWKYSQDQNEAVWYYNTKAGTHELFRDQFSIGWISSDTTGIIENNNRIWIHPPRHNQYSMNEIAPFPDFRKNMNIGDVYSSIMYISDGFGPWAGQKLKFLYNIIKVENKGSDTEWTVSTTSDIEGKPNVMVFIFSEKKGFISLDYSFYNGDKETLVLK